MDRGAALNCHILHNGTENETETEEGTVDLDRDGA